MLQLKTIDKDTFDLLNKMSAAQELNAFALAGGTALALQLGHRISVDLDFITDQLFDSFTLLEQIGESFAIEKSSTATNALSLFIQWQRSSVKVDCIRHNYPMLKPLITVKRIRLFSLEDIAAMKLNAVANRGAKKDFYDIHALLSCFSLPDMLVFFKVKYQNMNSFTVTKSLAYFDDADLEPDPLSLVATSWEQIKADIKQILANTA